MKVIGIGRNKTGTSSLSAALNHLGYNCKHNPRWFRMRHFLNGDLLGFDACCDWPTWESWRELLALYPTAKCILTTRDSESWLASAKAHVARNALIGRKWNSIGDEVAAILAYETHNQQVREFFGAHPEFYFIELRICDGEGWEKLCPFLGHTPPCDPFPWRNKTPQRRFDLVK